ncbi:K(+)-transporting ATPase subunit F [bacterium]|nr:K(+)-transporting ATPase subunit F [bacterium]
MDWTTALALCVTVVLAVFLIAALLKPEKFS